MPYARKRFNRRRQTKRVPIPVKKYVRNALNRDKETKQATLGAMTMSPSTYAGGSLLTYVLTQIAQGDGASDRDGNLIKVTGFYARFVCTYADTTNIIRFRLWMPKADNSVSATSVDYSDAIDQDTTRDFIDRIVTVGSGGPMQKTVILKKKFRKPLYFRYYGSAGTNIVTPYLMLSIGSDSGAVSHPTVTGHYRIYWKDV